MSKPYTLLLDFCRPSDMQLMAYVENWLPTDSKHPLQVMSVNELAISGVRSHITPPADFAHFDDTGFPEIETEFVPFMRRRYSRIGVSSAKAIERLELCSLNLPQPKHTLLDCAASIRLALRNLFSPFVRTPQIPHRAGTARDTPDNYVIPIHEEANDNFLHQLQSLALKGNGMCALGAGDAELTQLCDSLIYAPNCWNSNLLLIDSEPEVSDVQIWRECWRSAFRPFAEIEFVSKEQVYATATYLDLQKSQTAGVKY